MSPGIKRDNPLDVIFHKEKTLIHPEKQIDAKKISNFMQDLEDYFPAMHKEVTSMSESQRKLHRKYHDVQNKVQIINFTTGDFVLIAKDVDVIEGKLYLTWRGPYRVHEAEHGYIFHVKDIVDESKTLLVHGSRMRLYHESLLDVTEKMKVQKSFDDESFIIEKVLEQKDNKVLIKWKGFSEKENTWEPIEVIQKDAPALWKEFLASEQSRQDEYIPKKGRKKR